MPPLMSEAESRANTHMVDENISQVTVESRMESDSPTPGCYSRPATRYLILSSGPHSALELWGG